MTVDRLKSLAKRYESGLRIGRALTLPSVQVQSSGNNGGVDVDIYEPMICLILQGEKETTIGDQSVALMAGDALLVSHDLPVASKIADAADNAPYLELLLKLDLRLIRAFYDQVGDAFTTLPHVRSLTKATVTPDWAGPIERYLSMMDAPLDAQVLGPSVLRELHFRLLVSDLGDMLRHLQSLESHASRIAKAIAKLRTEFDAPLAVADLAELAGMSQSSFHAHFKSITGTTPRQYQKDLRMIKARALLQGTRASVSDVSKAVGYESPTHFCRDYARKFGLPPSKELTAA